MNTDAQSGIRGSNQGTNKFGRILSPIIKTLGIVKTRGTRELRGILRISRCLRRQVRAAQRHSQHKDYCAFMLAARAVFCEMPRGIERHWKQERG